MQACFDADAFSFPLEGPESLASLLEVAIAYGDGPCAQTVLAAAEKRGAPLDVNEPLPSYAASGDPYGAERPLARAADSDYSSARMLSVLLEAGADPAAVDATGLAAGDRLTGRLDSLVEGDALTREQADRFVAEHAESLGLAYSSARTALRAAA